MRRQLMEAHLRELRRSLAWLAKDHRSWLEEVSYLEAQLADAKERISDLELRLIRSERSRPPAALPEVEKDEVE